MVVIAEYQFGFKTTRSFVLTIREMKILKGLRGYLTEESRMKIENLLAPLPVKSNKFSSSSSKHKKALIVFHDFFHQQKLTMTERNKKKRKSYFPLSILQINQVESDKHFRGQI